MGKGTGISKAVAIGIGVLTVSSLCCLVLMAVMYKIQIDKYPPVNPPLPSKPPVLPTGLPPSLRLPDNVIPESYKVFLQPYFYPAITNNYTNQSFAFTGNSTVRIKCMTDSKTVFLHVLDLNVTTVEVRKSDSNVKLSLGGYRIHRNESNFLEIQLKDVMSGNETYYDIFTEFEGELQNDLTGFYMSQYTEKVKGDEDEDVDQERFLATSLMKPTDARKVFPCFDEPALKAEFEITVIHRPDTTALSNQKGAPDTTEIDGEEWVVTTFPKTPIMSTYLLALTVSDFTFVSKSSAIRINIYGRSEAINAGHADYALEITEKILNHYQKLFELKYSLEKIDQIALPDISVGAMENWGLISYQESGLLIDKNMASTFDQERVATLIAHELAHQGAAVLRMLATFIGDEEAFMKGIKTYLSKFQFQNVVYKDLWECLKQETSKDVEAFMSTWIKEVGYPVVTIITQTGELTQEQFLLKQSWGHGIAWQVDIRYFVSSDFVVKQDLLKVNGPVRRPHFQIEKKDEWLLANVDCAGFFRVNYDEENWNKLHMQLERNHEVIPLINRGQLIDDAFNLARASRLNVTIALSLTKYLINETEYIPWESALKNLDHLILMFDRSEVYGPITKYLRKQITPLYKHFEEYTKNGTIPEKHTDQYNQVNAISVACSHGLSSCITMASGLFRDYRNGTNKIHPNLRKEIYCSAIAAGDEDDWEFAWNEYQRATAPAEKDKLRYALSCTKEIWLLNRYLQYTLDPSKIRKTDMVSTINYIAKNVAGQPLAWDLLRQLQKEQDENDQDIAAQALEQVIERTEANIEWVKENKQLVKDWFIGEM
ncbi:aminopeptidase N-like protein [Labeo rohita]|uniref:Aminopeptidase n=1 Tax=Labeo rohita TaxID=84645 RepID=A0A498MMH9_LABRO|nr:aminopeptidase N-like protein [Labeo rohita]